MLPQLHQAFPEPSDRAAPPVPIWLCAMHLPCSLPVLLAGLQAMRSQPSQSGHGNPG